MRERMFIVDDEPAIVALCEIILERNGFVVAGSALDGEEAVSRFKALSEPVDMVLLDYRMPKKDGIEVMGELLNIDPTLKILFISADTHARNRAMESGASGFLAKPFGISELVGAIMRTLHLTEDDLKSAS